MRVEIKQIMKTETLILWDNQGKDFRKFSSFGDGGTWGRGQFLPETRPRVT